MEYRNAKILDADSTMIDSEINHQEHGWIPFNCVLGDPYTTFDSDALFNTMLADANTIAYVAPTTAEIEAKQASDLRGERKSILENRVDKYTANNLRWADLTAAQQAELSTYRQALLDITDQETFPESVTWPTEPDWI